MIYGLIAIGIFLGLKVGRRVGKIAEKTVDNSKPFVL